MTPRENSVKQLSEIYNVVTGAALAFAITNVIDTNADFIPIKSAPALCFLVFFVTLIPFHQGAVRHLFATYVEDGGSSRIARGALALDFVILFVEACLFVALALLLSKTSLFTLTLIVLLAVDCFWGFLASMAFTGAQAQSAEKQWSLINLVAVVVLIVLYIFAPPLLSGRDSDEFKICILLVCIVRTIIDYYVSWDFYYPAPKT